ncbi:MAG: DinB family protein [Gemmatimonadaceae bacterium]
MMKRLSTATIAAFTIGGCLALGACAQNTDSAIPPAATAVPIAGPNLMADLGRDVAGIEQKFVDLAKAMPEASYGWRPGSGVRSVREVFLHIASENYLLPSMFGAAIPATTGIAAGDFKSAETFEKRDIKKDSVVADLQASFAHMKQAMAADSAAAMSGEIDFFGTKMSRQAAWIGTVTHMHEHLGQLIAYARMNKVVPPWSK